ncbi:protein regulator of cytokinesis 1-like isoform X1 [Amblyomma americanum]
MQVERREALCSRFLEFEKRAADQSRLNHRGGCLLEMRARKRLETELPRLEEEIKMYISRHTGPEEQFLSESPIDFLEHLSSPHDAYNLEKDRERQERTKGLKNFQEELRRFKEFHAKNKPILMKVEWREGSVLRV